MSVIWRPLISIVQVNHSNGRRNHNDLGKLRGPVIIIIKNYRLGKFWILTTLENPVPREKN